MTIKEIYEKFDKIGCLTFATVNEEGEPETRIAHLRGYDNEGIYFMTMFTKGFYRELKNDNGNFTTSLVFTENKKVFDPLKVYKGIENPTKL